eukprot:scaffold183730_cov31-Tisochrysis_lutea.AAC.4
MPQAIARSPVPSPRPALVTDLLAPPQSWLSAGVGWVYFFQDTNAPALRVLPATLGVSVHKKLQVNSVCVARTPGESIGGIMTLKHSDGRMMTANVSSGRWRRIELRRETCNAEQGASLPYCDSRTDADHP